MGLLNLLSVPPKTICYGGVVLLVVFKKVAGDPRDAKNGNK